MEVKSKSSSPIQLNLNSAVKREVSKDVSSVENLKKGFDNLSSISVAQMAKDNNKKADVSQIKNEKIKDSDSNIKLSSSDEASLNQAVEYSKQAFDALEQVTAKNLTNTSVASLLSDDDKDIDSVRTLSFQKNISTPVVEIAKDMEVLKEDLRKLFSALKNKAETSSIKISNNEASNASTKDVDEALMLAKNTSQEIEFNPKKAMSAHNEIAPSRVSYLLRESEI